jgi:C4-dicarboxylate-specific signal transduction histidine kinase
MRTGRALFPSLRLLLVLIVLLAIVPQVALLIYSTQEARERAILDAGRAATQMVRAAARDFEATAEDMNRLLVALSQRPEVQNHDGAACSRLFADLVAQDDRVINLGAASTDGDVFCSGLPRKGPVNNADRDYFTLAVQTRGFAIGDYQVGRITGQASINFATPILGPAGVIKGVVYAALDLTWFNRIAARQPV